MTAEGAFVYHCKCGIPRDRRGWCRPCQTAYCLEWRRRRRAAGVPVKGPPNEKRLAWAVEYRRRNEVKKRTAERQRVRRLDPQELVKYEARAAVRDAIARGDMLRRPCFCGAAKAEAHHDDYGKPLEVMWLCRKHHNERHRALKAQQLPKKEG